VSHEPTAIRDAVLNVLGEIAPEADLAGLAAEANFRRELDLDSVDFQTFIIRLAKSLDAHIPDRDAGGLTSLAGCERYFRGP
jgi:acyl carrier protein